MPKSQSPGVAICVGAAVLAFAPRVQAQPDYPVAVWNPAHANNYLVANRGAFDIRWIVLHTTVKSIGKT